MENCLRWFHPLKAHDSFAIRQTNPLKFCFVFFIDLTEVKFIENFVTYKTSF